MKDFQWTPKRRKFCREYPKDLNATQAAIRAGYSRKGANRQASYLLSKIDIQREIAEYTKKDFEKAGIEAEKILQESARIALADIGPAFNRNGTLKDIHDIPTDLRRAISGIEVVEEFTGTGKERRWTGYLKKVKFWNKDKQVENLMRHLGLFLEDNKQAGQSFAAAVHAAHEAMKNK